MQHTLDGIPPLRAAKCLCASLDIEFDDIYPEPKPPDTG